MQLIGIWSDYASTDLLVVTAVTLVAFSVLLFFKPLIWAKMLMWKIPEETDLAVYFGRCLGAFALVTNIMFLQAALWGQGTVFVLQFFSLFCFLMIVVHVWGAIAKIQPVTETLETGFWLVLLILNLLVMPVSA